MASEYFRDLVREDRKRKEESRFEQILRESLDGGKPIEVSPEYWNKKRAAVPAGRRKTKR